MSVENEQNEKSSAKVSGCPVQHEKQPESTKNGCPMSTEGASVSFETFVTFFLQKDRVKSTILGKSENESWEYPSSEMFLKALQRKNKVEDFDEARKEVDAIVSIHNAMNEMTWKEILQFEALSYKKTFKIQTKKIEIAKELVENQNLLKNPLSVDEIRSNILTDCAPRLISFLGRPNQMSPKSWMMSMFSKKIHFDRHDWIVQRRTLDYPNNVTQPHVETRYIIDYYFDPEKNDQDQVPKSLHDAKSVQSISIDVRPALDTPSAFFNRIKFFALSAINKLPDFSLLQVADSNNNVDELNEKPDIVGKKENAEKKSVTLEEFKQQGIEIKTQCGQVFKELKECDQNNEERCGLLSLKLMLCMGNIVCTPQVMQSVTESDKGFKALDGTELNLSKVEECLQKYEALSKTINIDAKEPDVIASKKKK